MSKDHETQLRSVASIAVKLFIVTLLYLYAHFIITAVCSFWSIEVSLWAVRVGMISISLYLATHIAAILLTVLMLFPMFEKEGDLDGRETNKVLRVSYHSGLVGLVFGSTKNKVQNLVSAMNQNGYKLHLIHQDDINLVQILGRYLLLIVTLGVWTWGRNDLLIFEKNNS
jgi:hypothetical protein